MAPTGDLADALTRLLQGDPAASFDADDPAAAAVFAQVQTLVRAARQVAHDDAAPYLLDPAAIADALSLGREVFVAIVGVGRFGELRRQVGSKVASGILKRLCDRMQAWLPRMRLGRVGRTQVEFMFSDESSETAWTTLYDLRHHLEQRFAFEGQTFDLDVVIGFARHEPGEDAVIEEAAIALARAHGAPTKIAEFTVQERTDALARLQLLKDLRQAIDGGGDQLFLCYQPKLHVKTGVIDAVEALIRWRHPERGLLPPDEFIGLAEETGIIGDLTRWVLLRAMEDRRRFVEAGRELSVHINLSGRLVPDTTFTEWILTAVEGMPKGALGLEITETALIDDPDKALRNLQALAAAGLTIAIDDYGSGLSSLSYLKQLPASELKIDKAFISGLASSHSDPLLVRSTIDLAHALEMEVTAEGVETPAALALLRMMGCDLIQGYIISRPLDVPALLMFLSQELDIQTISLDMMSLGRSIQ